MQENNQKGRSIAIVAMIFLFGMIAFVTNLAAPIGVIWKNQPALEGSNTLGMLGNMMNFLAYLFMGIPSGKMLQRIGYKKTALVAVAFGFFGVFIQFLSGQLFTHSLLMGLPTNFYVYLLGAFVAGIVLDALLIANVYHQFLEDAAGGVLVHGYAHPDARWRTHRHGDEGHRHQRCQHRALSGYGHLCCYFHHSQLHPHR